jgi:hypothetical protein
MGTRTISGYTFNVYGTAAGLTEYAAGSFTFAAAVSAAVTDAVARAHVEATRLIARMPFKDAADADVDTAHVDVVTACYELACAAVADPKVLAQDSAAKNVKRVGAKGAEVEFFAPTPGGRFPLRVLELLGPRLTSADTYASAYVSGVSDGSDFDDDDRYGIAP